ncbi:MAG: TonB-dependent receptor [Acidobacteriia bacterium]|nr:TonB-dependent receptor [Terriglobia bacterium]
MFSQCLLLIFSGLFLLVAGAVQACAQQNAGGLGGTVLDPTGGAVQGATVVARNESSAAANRTATDAGGKFSFTNLAIGNYTLEVSTPGFALASRSGVHVTADRAEELTFTLTLGSVNDAITVEANTSGSLAAQNAPMDSVLETTSARTEVTPIFVQNFTTPLADFGELVAMAPGTFSISTDGVGLGQDKTYFRGFADGNYDIDFDGVPFYDTNDPTHHTWAFFPSPWVGSVDFDRSPGTASTIGPTPFGGSIHLLSPTMEVSPVLRATVSYGSFHTILTDATFDSGLFGGKKSNLLVDVQHMQSSGFETYNYQYRNAGSLKYVYKFSENNVLTGFSGVVWLDSNTPNNNPIRAQIDTFGYNFMNSNDSNAAEITPVTGACNQSHPALATCLYPLYYQFYTYHIPTDFEYVDWSKQWGNGWQTDFKPYTLSYYNAQFYNNPKYNTDGTFKSGAISSTSAVDKLNSYRKYGENFVVSQVSKYGIFRTGLWYEWATTNRYQIQSNPLTHVDVTLPNFHETFYTSSYQPYAEYEFHATQKFTVTAGFKYAYFNQNLTQFQDQSKVGCLAPKVGGVCVPSNPPLSVNHAQGYSSYLPSVGTNYHLTNTWSLYGQYGRGTKVPPSAVFDVTGGNVIDAPPPTEVSTYQGGTVLKLKHVTLNADGYYIKYQGAFTSIPDTNNSTGFDYVNSGDAISKGFEAEANIYITKGISVYSNFTGGKAYYSSPQVPNSVGVLAANPNFGRRVANTPTNTESIGVMYQQKHFDVGMFDKRIGPMWNDLSLASGAVASQVIPINPFSLANFYFNYIVRNGSRFDQTKFRLSVNNLFNQRGIIGDQQTANTTATYVPGNSDQLTLLPGRSIALTVTFGLSSKR